MEAAPGFLGKHDLLVDLVHIRLDITGLHLVRHQNPLRAGRHHQIFKAHAQYRPGVAHTILADTKLHVIEVQIGEEISVHDKRKLMMPE